MSGQPTTPALIEHQERSLGRQLEWIRAVDGKIGFTSATALAMLGVVAALSPDVGAMSLQHAIWIVIGGAGPVVALVFCYFATFPQVAGPDSMLFFGSISRLKPREYAQRVEELTEAQYLADLIAQVHRNASIAAAKYADSRRAMLSLFVSTLPWLLAIGALYGV